MKLKVEKNKGFALLFSVLIASLLLTVGLSIFRIALKELALSTSARQSIHSFFAADSGRECAKYWDTKMGAIPTRAGRYLEPDRTGGELICGGMSESINLDKDLMELGVIPDKVPSDIENVPLMSVSPRGPYFSVSIIKQINKVGASGEKPCPDKIDNYTCTTITSSGYDSTDDDRVERAIQETY